MYNIESLFCTPVYLTHKDTGLSLSEMEEVKGIINEDMHSIHFESSGHRRPTHDDSYIFETKLKNLKEFCEQHIEIYVREIISSAEGVDFYITQSWLILTEPGGGHPIHCHPNSIISGVFYIATVEDDKIYFYDPNANMKERIEFNVKRYNHYNSNLWSFPINPFDLILFPSWLRHSVEKNEKATTNRISIAFNVFPKGILGERKMFNELKLV
jgi:uncharacterized protein (TIGR02466 family)